MFVGIGSSASNPEIISGIEHVSGPDELISEHMVDFLHRKLSRLYMHNTNVPGSEYWVLYSTKQVLYSDTCCTIPCKLFLLFFTQNSAMNYTNNCIYSTEFTV